MAMFKKISTKTLIVLFVAGLVLLYLYQSNSGPKKAPRVTSGYGNSYYTPGMNPMKPTKSMKNEAPGISGSDVNDVGDYAPADMSGSINLDIGCSMNSGTGLASSLMPREVASQEDYAQFAPNDILKGQNFLDPRQQVGWPETIGGTIRNGNHDLRADPPNPKDQYIWNNSTIVPDLMQRNLFCN
jgi:hypothetical protein